MNKQFKHTETIVSNTHSTRGEHTDRKVPKGMYQDPEPAEDESSVTPTDLTLFWSQTGDLAAKLVIPHF